MSTLDVERICRLCCTIKDRMCPLFEQQQEYPLALNQMIDSIVDLKVDPNDGLPQKICSQCVHSLMRIYQTIQSYRQNDLFLRKQLIRAKPAEFDVLVEMEQINIKQEVMEEDCNGPEPLSEWNDTDVKQEAWAHEEIITDDLDIPIKNEPLDVQDDDCQLEDTDQNAATDVPKPGRLHSKTQDPNRPKLNDYNCYICHSESYETEPALLVHLNSKHMDLLPFTCSWCVMGRVVLNSLFALNEHLGQHSNPQKCPHCDMRYLTKRKLADHLQQQHPGQSTQGPPKCKHCGKIFPSMPSLGNHVKTYHSNSRPQFTCSYCQKAYSTAHSKRAHERNHIRNPDYKAYRNWTQYYTIVEDQEGIKNKKHKCKLCGEITSKINRHLQHVHFAMTHDCKICGKSIKRTDHFRKHMAKHKREGISGPSSSLNGERSDFYEPEFNVEHIEADTGAGGSSAEDSIAE